MPQSKIIYLGVRGSVLAVEAASGRPLWATTLKGSDFVNVVLDGYTLYATTHGEVFCLDSKTGTVRWHNPLKGYGWGLVTIAGDGISQNQFAVVADEKRRRDQQAASSGAAGSS
jgi:outer membrane protein assembly factor BamB